MVGLVDENDVILSHLEHEFAHRPAFDDIRDGVVRVDEINQARIVTERSPHAVEIRFQPLIDRYANNLDARIFCVKQQ